MNREKSVFILVGAQLVFPMVSSLLLSFSDLQVVYINYIFLGICAIFLTVIMPKSPGKLMTLFGRRAAALAVLGLLILLFDRLVRGPGTMFAIARSYGLLSAALALFALSKLPKVSGKRVFDWLTIFCAVVFLIQLGVSIRQSVSGVSHDYLSNSYDWNGMDKRFKSSDQQIYGPADVEDRLQLKVFAANVNVPFQIGFDGMLGASNHWGTQLPFYLLIFLYRITEAKPRRLFFLICSFLIIFAAFFNTTRFSILAVVVTLAVFGNYVMPGLRALKGIVLAAVLIFLYWYGVTLARAAAEYVSKTDTMTLRLQTWSVFGRFIFARDLLSILVGSTFDGLYRIRQLLQWPDTENEVLEILFDYGLVFLIYAFANVVFLVKKMRRMGHKESFFTKLILFDVFAVTIWSNVLFRYSTMIPLSIFTYRMLLSVYDNVSPTMQATSAP
ncbi:MAG TPA: hypothetical protein VLX91_10515 [Candidatus Acidoferrales bacterium]|nr:hypothetical protein [Candidatus Acidoferrales bacterium]